MPALTIRPSTGPAEYPALVAIWRGAVDATHDFLAAADRDEIEAALPSNYLPAVALSVAERDVLLVDVDPGDAALPDRVGEERRADPTAVLRRVDEQHLQRSVEHARESHRSTIMLCD